jgi:hypothetical protein
VTTLTQAYAAHLAGSGDASTLAGLLREHGYLLDAHLLEQWAAGTSETTVDVDGLVWSGRTARLGRQLPAQRAPGELWFDPLEVTTSILLPREFEEGYPAEVMERLTPYVGWLALRPTAVWQLAGMLEVAPLKRRDVFYDIPKPAFDAERVLAAPEDTPARALVADEAVLYAAWFGKSVATAEYWEAAVATLSAEELASLWGANEREWANFINEGVRATISRESVGLDLWDAYEADPDSDMFHADFATPADVGFRTAVSTQDGLHTGVRDALSVLDVELAHALDRS